MKRGDFCHFPLIAAGPIHFLLDQKVTKKSRPNAIFRFRLSHRPPTIRGRKTWKSHRLVLAARLRGGFSSRNCHCEQSNFD
jgi:hypothetical protein